jgi:TolA-binding protein
MISTRRILAAACLAAGVGALAAPTAGAAETDAQAGSLSPIAMLDSLSVSDIPERHQDAVPRPSQQLNQLNRVPSDLNQLHQVTDLAAPVTGLLPGIEY